MKLNLEKLNIKLIKKNIKINICQIFIYNNNTIVFMEKNNYCYIVKKFKFFS